MNDDAAKDALEMAQDYALTRFQNKTKTMARLTEKQRFFEKVSLPNENGCMEWMAGKDVKGYGHFWRTDHRMHMLAHRWAFDYWFGPIPEKMFVCHRCDNPKCVAPAHLFLGTHTENMRDMMNKGRAIRARGEKNGRSKLTTDDIAIIRELYSVGGITKTEIGKLFGVHRSGIGRIIRHERWKYTNLATLAVEIKTEIAEEVAQ